MSKGLALIVGYDAGRPILARLDGKCGDLAAGDRGIGLITGSDGGKPVISWSDQRCAPGTSNFEVGKKYLGLVTGTDAQGRPIISSWCKEGCAGDAPFTACDCTICCTLDATVQVASAGDPTVWTDPVDVTLTCGGALTVISCYSCCSDTVEDECVQIVVEQTWSDRDTTGSPEPWGPFGGYEGTSTIRSQTWSSGEFEIEGKTYRLFFRAWEETVHQTAPTEYDYVQCNADWILQRWEPPVPDSTPGLWQTMIASNSYGGGGGGSYAVPFDYSDDNPYSETSCPEGFHEAGGECPEVIVCGFHPAYTGDPLLSVRTTSSALCDEEDGTYVMDEAMICLGTAPYPTCSSADESTYLKCAKILIADNCEEEFFDDEFFDPDFFG